LQFQSRSPGIVNTVCSASVSSSHTGHNFSEDLTKAHLPLMTSPQIQIFPVWEAMLLSGCRSLTQSFGNTLFELAMVETPELPLEFHRYYHSSRDIRTSGLGNDIAISGCRSLSQSLSLNSSWSMTPCLPLKSNTFVVLLLKLVHEFK